MGTKVFYMRLIASDSHRSPLYSLHVPTLPLSVSETIFPSPEVKNLHVWVGQNPESGLVHWLKTVVAIGHNSVGDTALHLRTEREAFPKFYDYQRRKKSGNTIMLIIYQIITVTIHKNFSSSPQNEDSF